MSLESLVSDLLELFEGEKLVAYKDTGEVWTIGRGHTGPEVHEGLVWTPEQSASAFAKDNVPLFTVTTSVATTVARAAWISFGYNAGVGRLSGFYDKQKNWVEGYLTRWQRQDPRIAADFLNYCHDKKGNRLSWLVKRRRLEWGLITA